jgi:8-oxo-dGTP pyrophosphatase MutT (NUDIX family)
MSEGVISVVAALVRDDCGRVLLVRKRGTTAFMQPGGKRAGGETDVAALSRELSEELGCRVSENSARSLGCSNATPQMNRAFACVPRFMRLRSWAPSHPRQKLKRCCGSIRMPFPICILRR